MLKQKLLCLALVVPLAALAPEICHAQLFGGGGFRGGGGGFRGGGFGGGFRGGGGFGGGFRGGGFGGGAPVFRAPAISRPIVRPSAPIVSRPVINRPIASPPAVNRPIIGGPRPVIGGGPVIGRPGIGTQPAPPLAANRPIGAGLPAVANRPVIGQPNLPGAVQPVAPVTRDRLNNFLNSPPGANRPVAGALPAPPAPADRPIVGAGDRPILGGDRPGGPGDRPILGNRPIVDRPIMPNLGEKILGNELRKEIVSRRLERSVRVRDRIRELYYRENHPWVYWYHYMWTKHPIWSWWRMTAPVRWANWSSVTGWCGYNGSYAEPVTYEYTDEGVYANGQEVQVDDGYSQQALELAQAGAALLKQKVDAQEADKLEWLPLGVFSICNSADGDPTMFLQLAISREGIVAGSFANTTNNENLSVQGGADRESTRLAITIGDKDDVVIETGLYNVTEQQSSALVHYQDGKRENWLLVKMADPQGKQAQP